MKKGELRKESIMRTAEKLFFEKGYAQTSIQDILDALSISKGGFYHYFESKNALLEEICRERSAREIERIRMGLFSAKLNPIQKLNLLLETLNIFNQGDSRFAALFLKVSYVDGDVHFREQIRVFMMDSLRPMVDEVLREGMADDSFFIRNPGQAGRLLMMLGYDVNDEVCRILSRNADNPDCVIAIIDLLDAYRESIEALCGASHGSIFLFDLEHLMETFRQTAAKLNLMKEY